MTASPSSYTKMMLGVSNLNKASLPTAEEEHKSSGSDDGAASAAPASGCGCGEHHGPLAHGHLATKIDSPATFEADSLREASEALAAAADAGGLSSLDADARIEVMARCCKVLLEAVGEDPARDGIIKTPTRMAKAMLELTRGYHMDPQATLQKALFDVDGGGSMVVVKNIEFSSLCEHHVLPFRGTVHIAYIPGDRVVGLSKLARITDIFAKRLQVQERLTRQIAEAVVESIGAKGACVLVEAEHMCMSMRGANKPGASTTTLVKLGEFKTDPSLVAEFRMHVGR